MESWVGHRLQRSMLQLVNLGWAVGAVICPLMVQPFLVKLQTTISLMNTSSLEHMDLIVGIEGVTTNENLSDKIVNAFIVALTGIVLGKNQSEDIINGTELQHSEAGIEQVLLKYVPNVALVRYAYISVALIYIS